MILLQQSSVAAQGERPWAPIKDCCPKMVLLESL